MAKADLTAQRLREILHYAPDTGIFTWLISPKRAIHTGCRAGGIDCRGYRTISIKRTRYFEHRLAWLYTHGIWPQQSIDHIDGNKSNNRIENLRDASDNINHQNLRRAKKDNRSGFLGVTSEKRPTPYRAHISVNGKRHYLGSFMTPEAAHEAYLAAKRRLHPGNTL